MSRISISTEKGIARKRCSLTSSFCNSLFGYRQTTPPCPTQYLLPCFVRDLSYFNKNFTETNIKQIEQIKIMVQVIIPRGIICTDFFFKSLNQAAKLSCNTLEKECRFIFKYIRCTDIRGCSIKSSLIF